MATHIIDQHTTDLGSAFPQITSGVGVPAFTAPSGSIYVRTDGSGGARIYVNQNGGTSWTAVATV